ncbi:BREX-2 system phosphatase PglZ [Sinorhizobium meliloti]|nr:BREX-2 system phosphatase PglZ [Sinorhizobium meliloti]MDW9509478.1 BREX-2 system phosphatase PglZ [Sinorhizobium meliloti]
MAAHTEWWKRVSPLLAPSRRQLEVFLDREPEARVLGVRSPIRRPWPEFIERHGKQFRIVWCESALEIREALAGIEDGPDARLLLITHLEDSLLGADVVARFPRGRLMATSRWDALRAAFSARDLDPRLRGQDWLSDLLLDRPPAAGYPPVPGGVLDLDTAWRFCLEHAVGLPDARADVGALLAWTAGEGNLDRFEALPQTTQEKILEKVASEGGCAAALVARAVSAGHGADALAIGLACGVIFAPTGPSEYLRDAAIRLEPAFGGGRIAPDAGSMLADAAGRVIARLDAPVAQVHQARASVWLNTVRATEQAGLSRALTAGLEARLITAAEAISQAAESTGTQGLARATQLVRLTLDHERAGDHRARLERLEMAARLCRWLSGSRRSIAGFGGAAKAYAEEGGFVDWARASLRAGDSVPAVAAAYARLRELAGIRREEENRAFADLLRDWNAGGAGGEETLPIERTLDSIVAPLAAHAPVLLLVLDGLSFPVARPLVADIARQGWIELSPEGRVSPPPLVAALPSVTEVSRTSLLSGRLVRGNAAAERAAFGAHQRLREVSRAGKPPILFHKADLGAGPELNERVRTALTDMGQRVVGIVHNAVDAQLAGSDQIELLWSTEVLRQVAPLLRAAREAGRLVILTSDHGHVLDAGTTHVQGRPGDRWRSGENARDGEFEVRDGRVMSPDGTRRAVLVWSERLRYSAKRSGYHGGGSPQEVLVPLAVLTSGPAPRDWVEAPPSEPEWWSEGGALPATASVTPSPPSRRPETRQIGRFEMTPSAEAWIDALLVSPTYVAQRGLAGRGAPDDAVVRELLSALAARGGRLSRTALAQALQLPAFRAAGLVNAAKRVLNVDQAQVLSLDATADEVILNIRLLRVQFEIGGTA